MSQKTVPILMASIAVLFAALVVIIAVMLGSPERRLARDIRNQAVRTLLSRSIEGEEPEALNLAALSSYIASPFLREGSLDDLFHFLSKDPGRRTHPRAADRRRTETYLAGPAGNRAAEYAAEFGSDVPPWVPEYVGSVRALFDIVRDDILRIAGVPDELTYLHNPNDGSRAAVSLAENAVGRFGNTWIAPGETAAGYRTDRTAVRDYLMGNRRFLKRQQAVDNAWKNLASALYTLSASERWKIAAAYAPELDVDLDEIIIIVLAADIHRRSRDLMAGIEDGSVEPGEPVGPGIFWMPEFSYYKNIPELTGLTADEESTIFFAKVNLGYTFRDGRTQTWLNRRKDWLSDYFSTFFSNLVSDDFSPSGGISRDLAEWRAARLKAEAVHGINERIAVALPFGVKKVYGVRDIALVRVNLLGNP